MAEERSSGRPLFMISIAAELARMHPQTLRVYERRGLLLPQRSAKNTRLYSQLDVDRLRRIQELTDLGLNLAGVERVLEMEDRIREMAAEMEAMRSQLLGAAERMRSEVRRVEQAQRRDLVRIGRVAIVPVRRREGR
jgi:MerR family transcriptional regulator, heat shock protein HspR